MPGWKVRRSIHCSSARQAKEKPQKKKFKKAAVEVPTSADIDRKQLSMKHKKQAAKQVSFYSPDCNMSVYADASNSNHSQQVKHRIYLKLNSHD